MVKISEVVDGFDLSNVVPFFQPIVDLHTNVVVGYECLARMVTASERMFLPSEFLSLVEKERCSGQLARRIFQLSAHYFRETRMPWSMNISAADMQDDSFALFIRDQLVDYPQPQRVTLEIMGSVAVTHPDAFNRFVSLCKQLKIRVYVDRFAASMVNWQGVLAMPIQGIKIDGELIKQLPHSEEAKAILSELLTKAAEQNIAVVAEHIEDNETLGIVKSMNIPFGQGFFFSYPAATVH